MTAIAAAARAMPMSPAAVQNRTKRPHRSSAERPFFVLIISAGPSSENVRSAPIRPVDQSA